MHDTRGGWNKKPWNQEFFSTSSRKRAYYLGLIMADGACINSIASRTFYLKLCNSDYKTIARFKKEIGSQHKIEQRRAGNFIIKGKLCTCSTLYSLRIGSQKLGSDLTALGVGSKKSYRLTLPPLEDNLFGDFLRGYFDGDGCLSLENRNTHCIPRVIFTSCCKEFLIAIKDKTFSLYGLSSGQINLSSNGACQLTFQGKNAMGLLQKTYHKCNNQPFMESKKDLFDFAASVLD